MFSNGAFLKFDKMEFVDYFKNNLLYLEMLKKEELTIGVIRSVIRIEGVVCIGSANACSNNISLPWSL